MLWWSLVKLTECTPRALAVPAGSVAEGRLHRKNPHQESCKSGRRSFVPTSNHWHNRHHKHIHTMKMNE